MRTFCRPANICGFRRSPLTRNFSDDRTRPGISWTVANPLSGEVVEGWGSFSAAAFVFLAGFAGAGGVSAYRMALNFLFFLHYGCDFGFDECHFVHGLGSYFRFYYVLHSGDSGEVEVQFGFEVAVGLEVADFGHVSPDRDFGSVAESVDVGVVGVFGYFAAFEAPVGSDDLRG